MGCVAVEGTSKDCLRVVLGLRVSRLQVVICAYMKEADPTVGSCKFLDVDDQRLKINIEDLRETYWMISIDASVNDVHRYPLSVAFVEVVSAVHGADLNASRLRP